MSFTEMRFCFKNRLIIANNAVGLLFVGVRVQHRDLVAPKITRPLFGILVTSITCALTVLLRYSNAPFAETLLFACSMILRVFF